MHFLKKRMKSWLSQGAAVSQGTLPSCKQALRYKHDLSLLINVNFFNAKENIIFTLSYLSSNFF